jgi:hypothetical protein
VRKRSTEAGGTRAGSLAGAEPSADEASASARPGGPGPSGRARVGDRGRSAETASFNQVARRLAVPPDTAEP